MANFQHTTTAQEDQAVQWYAQQANARTGEDKSALDYAHDGFQAWLTAIVQAHTEFDAVDWKTLFNRASAEHKAQIVAILDSYR